MNLKDLNLNSNKKLNFYFFSEGWNFSFETTKIVKFRHFFLIESPNVHKSISTLLNIDDLIFKLSANGEEKETVHYDPILVDGWEKTVIVANHSIPGPPFIVYKNQTVIIHVTNDLIRY